MGGHVSVPWRRGRALQAGAECRESPLLSQRRLPRPFAVHMMIYTLHLLLMLVSAHLLMRHTEEQATRQGRHKPKWTAGPDLGCCRAQKGMPLAEKTLPGNHRRLARTPRAASVPASVQYSSLTLGGRSALTTSSTHVPRSQEIPGRGPETSSALKYEETVEL